MVNNPIISVLNLKNGVGCSTLAWNIAHTLKLDIYQHDKALHHYFMSQREESVKSGDLFCNEISVYNIDKKKFASGIYDLGSDINYPYVRQILEKSDAIIIPVETGYEVLLKSIATIKYVQEHNKDSQIYIVINRLDDRDSEREKNYSSNAVELIRQHVRDAKIEFLYIRHSLAIYKNLASGFFFLDNYIYQKEEFKPITHFNLLRNLRWHSINKMLDSKRSKKAEEEMEKTTFFKKHESFYRSYTKDIDISRIYDLKFNDNNRRLIKDMLILTTKIKGEYSLNIWEN